MPHEAVEALIELSDDADSPIEAQLVDEVQQDSILEQQIVGQVPSDLLPEDEREHMATFFQQEIDEARAERGDLMDNLEDWQEAYDAAPADESKDWPIRGAANLTVPVIKEIVNTLVSQFTQTILTPSPTWVMDSLAEEWDPFKSLIEDFMDIASERELDFDETIATWILECVKYGTSVIEAGHDYREKKFYVYGNADSEDEPQPVESETRVVSEGPELYNVPLEDFFIRFNESDLQEAKWCGKRLIMSERDLKDRVHSGQFEKEKVEKILAAFDEAEEDQVSEQRDEQQDTEHSSEAGFELFELWFSWNLDDGDDIETELRAFYHHQTQTFLTVTFNPFWHGKRPFVSLTYFPVEYQFYGDGVCKQLTDIQEEISTIHNQRLDNATLANFRMVVVSRMNSALKPGDPLYSGKIIEADDPARDVVPFQLSEVYPSTVQNEQIARRYAERVSGISEAQSVGGKPVSRTTATAQQMLLQEGAKRFDQTVRQIRSGITQIGRLVLSTYFQFGAGDKPELWMGKRGRIVSAIFRLPGRASEIGTGLRAAAPTSKLNKETRRQNSLALFNLMVQLYEKFLQLAGQVSPQAVPVIASEMAEAAQKFMFDVLDDFDVNDPEGVLAGLNVLEKVLPNAEDLGGLESFREGEEAAQILDQLGELESVLRSSDGSEGGRRDMGDTGSELRRFLETQRRTGNGGPGPGASQEGPGGFGEVGGPITRGEEGGS